MPTLKIIRGASGSGKTTLAQNLGDYFEADMFFIKDGKYKFDFRKLKEAHKWCQEVVENRMMFGESVVVSNTFTKIWEMQPYLDMADRYGFDIQIIHCQGKFKNVHGVPEEKVQQMRDNFEPYIA